MGGGGYVLPAPKDSGVHILHGCASVVALSRLSPEIYMKRPAQTDAWRLDLILKRKAVSDCPDGRGALGRRSPLPPP